MKAMTKFLPLFFICTIVALSFSSPVFASTCGGVETSVIDCEEGNGIRNVLLLTIEFLSIGVGILAVIGILISGIQYLTAGQDVAQTTKAKRRISEIIIGIAFWAIAFSFCEWLLPGGILNSSDLEPKISVDNNTSPSNAPTESTTTPNSTPSQSSASPIGTSLSTRLSTTATEPNTPDNSSTTQPNSSTQTGAALTQSEAISLFNSMSTPTYDEVKQLAKSIYGNQLSDEDFTALVAWNRIENYWDQDSYLTYLCSSVMLNNALSNYYGASTLSTMKGWGSVYQNADTIGSRQYYENNIYGTSYVERANAAALKATYLALKYPQTGIHNCYGPGYQPANTFYAPNPPVTSGGNPIYVW